MVLGVGWNGATMDQIPEIRRGKTLGICKRYTRSNYTLKNNRFDALGRTKRIKFNEIEDPRNYLPTVQ